MTFFVLEDDQERINLFCSQLPPGTVTIRTNVPEAIKAWSPPYDVVCLDHDLGGEVSVPSEHDNTGAAFVRWLVERPNIKQESKLFVVHSWNYSGAYAMTRLLIEAGCQTLQSAFGPRVLNYISKLAPKKEPDNVT